MFNAISGRYDLLNRSLSFRRDLRWRKKCVRAMRVAAGERIADLACGTGDMITALRRSQPDCEVTGADFSLQMLTRAREKTDAPLVAADVCALPFPDGYFDRITMAFGFRNVMDKRRALSEMARVLKSGGRISILEFSEPKGFLFSKLYRFYFRVVLPVVGRAVSGHKDAYAYLPESVKNFPPEEEYRQMVKAAGFSDPAIASYDFGICGVLTAEKTGKGGKNE